MTSATLIGQYLGYGLAASRPATPAIDTNTIAFWFATDTGVLSQYANGSWSNVGASPGTPPTIVQSGFADSASSSSVTLGSAPTNGNLLVAACSGGNNTAASGWTAAVTNSGGASLFGGIYTKTAGAGESTSQNPITGTGNSATVMWEIHGAAASPIVFANAGVGTPASVFAATAQAPGLANVLALGALTGDNALATFSSFLNMTQDVTSASVRGLKGGHSTGSTPIAQAIGKLSSSVRTLNYLILLTS